MLLTQVMLMREEEMVESSCYIKRNPTREGMKKLQRELALKWFVVQEITFRDLERTLSDFAKRRKISFGYDTETASGKGWLVTVTYPLKSEFRDFVESGQLERLIKDTLPAI